MILYNSKFSYLLSTDGEHEFTKIVSLIRGTGKGPIGISKPAKSQVGIFSLSSRVIGGYRYFEIEGLRLVQKPSLLMPMLKDYLVRVWGYP